MDDKCPNCGSLSYTGLCLSCQEKAKSLSSKTGKSYDPNGYFNKGEIDYKLGKERKTESDELWKNDSSDSKKFEVKRCPNCNNPSPLGLCMTCQEKAKSLSSMTGKSYDPLGHFGYHKIDYELGKARKKESDERKKSKDSELDWEKIVKDALDKK